jgi:16S rRNA (guanine(1405)-N(7))-methyltransferase
VSDEARLVGALRDSRKYRHVCDETLGRVARWALARAAAPAAAEAVARRKLHQVYGAYATPEAWRTAEKTLDALPPAPSAAAVEEACRRVLRLHASTRERLPIVERCFAEVFAITGPPASVVDLACGLDPFALPWMGLAPAALYTPLDIDERLAGIANRLLALLGRPRSAACLDLLGDAPLPEADVVLLLKSLPCLERQDAGAPAAVLGKLRCKAAVLSFPLKSLGGRERGMRESYHRRIEELLPRGRWTKREYPGEVFYIWSR